jgi:rRNA maturation protein Nop10
MTYTCPVCGFDDLKEPPYSREGHGLFEICPSCGFQFGVTDDDLGISFREWRESWVAKGMPWSSIGIAAPARWNPREQLQKLSLNRDD